MSTKYFFKIQKRDCPLGTHAFDSASRTVGSVDLKIVQGDNVFNHNKIVRFALPMNEPWSKNLVDVKKLSADFLKNVLLKNIKEIETESESEEEFVWVSKNT